MQLWPPLTNEPQASARAARSTSASDSTSAGSLPPSSSEAGMKRRAQASATLRPVATEPVKQTWSTASINAWPVAPAPVTTAKTSANPASARISRSSGTKREVTSLGLARIVQPAASAGTASIRVSISGKFHGLMTPTTV